MWTFTMDGWRDTCWFDSGSVYMVCDGGLGPCWLGFFALGGLDLGGGGAGRWQNFPVEFDGHQQRSRPMQRPPF